MLIFCDNIGFKLDKPFYMHWICYCVKDTRFEIVTCKTYRQHDKVALNCYSLLKI